MKNSLILFTVLFIMKVGHPQITFERTYLIGDAQIAGKCVKQTNDNGYIIACSRSGSYWPQGLMIKTNEYGDTIWCKEYFHEKDLNFLSVIQTAEGGYAMTGYWTENVQPFIRSICIVKIDEYGEELWSKDYFWDDHYMGYNIQQTEDNGFIITGRGKVGNIFSNTIMMKTDMNGDSLWTKIYTGYPYNWGGNEVLESNEGGYVIIGGELWEDEISDAFLLRTDENGNITGTKTYNLSYSESGISIHEIEGVGYLISGEVSYSYQGNSDLFLMKTDLEGDEIWTKYYGSTDHEYGGWSDVSVDGSIYLTGSKYLPWEGWNVFTIKVDSIGEMEWLNEYTGAQNYFVQATNDGGSIATGYAYDPDEDPLLYLLKTDELGVVTWINSPTIPIIDEIYIYPNPSYSTITIELPTQQSINTSLTISNINGQQLITQPITEPQTEIDISHLPNGIYIVKVWNDKEVMVQKVIKQ